MDHEQLQAIHDLLVEPLEKLLRTELTSQRELVQKCFEEVERATQANFDRIVLLEHRPDPTNAIAELQDIKKRLGAIETVWKRALWIYGAIFAAAGLIGGALKDKALNWIRANW